MVNLSELNALDKNIHTWMEKDVSIDDVESEIIDRQLIDLIAKG